MPPPDKHGYVRLVAKEVYKVLDWLLDSNGTYHRIVVSDESFSAHKYFMTNPSLSGMGSALEKISPENLISLDNRKE